MNTFKKILSWLLFQANSQPRVIDKTEFYKIKERLLIKYSKIVAYEYQHFEEQECYRCAGTGEFWTDYHNREECWCCGGTGIYQTEKWIGLKKYQFGNHFFHVPTGRIEGSKPDPIPTQNIIEGIIRHEKRKYSRSANYLLFAFYEPKYLLKSLFRKIPFWKIQIRINQVKNSIIKEKVDPELPF